MKIILCDIDGTVCDDIKNEDSHLYPSAKVIEGSLEQCNKLFDTYNLDVSIFDKDVDHFNQILYTSEFYLETQNSDLTLDAIDYYEQQHSEEAFSKLSEEEQAKIKDKIYDDEEESQALDIGDDVLDEEGRFDLYSNYNFQDGEKVFDRNYAFE